MIGLARVSSAAGHGGECTFSAGLTKAGVLHRHAPSGHLKFCHWRVGLLGQAAKGLPGGLCYVGGAPLPSRRSEATAQAIHLFGPVPSLLLPLVPRPSAAQPRLPDSQTLSQLRQHRPDGARGASATLRAGAGRSRRRTPSQAGVEAPRSAGRAGSRGATCDRRAPSPSSAKRLSCWVGLQMGQAWSKSRHAATFQQGLGPNAPSCPGGSERVATRVVAPRPRRKLSFDPLPSQCHPPPTISAHRPSKLLEGAGALPQEPRTPP